MPVSIATMMRVYPRACGGTHQNRLAAWDERGLSPRVRGNPKIEGLAATSDGSIPARAGEPTTDAPAFAVCAVYPRACGGTAGTKDWSLTMDGLSPRVRGNLGRRAFCRVM